MANAAEALKEKAAGNEAYKKKDFETALTHYNKAIELDPTNVIFRINKSAVYFEQGEFETCIKECLDAVDVGRENKAEFKTLAKAFARAGNSYHKLKDYDNAIYYFNKSLSESRDPAIVTRVNELEKELKDAKRREYIDPEKALEEKQKGNENFQKGDYSTAMKHYTEAIARNPDDAKLYSNRAACYTKLAEFKLALKDCEDCLRLDPKFVKGYLRKGGILKGINEYTKAQDAFLKALELDPDCKEASDGYRSCAMMDQKDPEEIKKRAMQDPEVASILSDPAMQHILNQMQSSPQALKEHLQNPEIRGKIQKLMECGILAFR